MTHKHADRSDEHVWLPKKAQSDFRAVCSNGRSFVALDGCAYTPDTLASRVFIFLRVAMHTAVLL